MGRWSGENDVGASLGVLDTGRAAWAARLRRWAGESGNAQLLAVPRHGLGDASSGCGASVGQSELRMGGKRWVRAKSLQQMGACGDKEQLTVRDCKYHAC
jgi:hypothetical protein